MCGSAGLAHFLPHWFKARLFCSRAVVYVNVGHLQFLYTYQQAKKPGKIALSSYTLVFLALPADGYAYHRVDALFDPAFLPDLYCVKNTNDIPGCIVVCIWFAPVFHW